MKRVALEKVAKIDRTVASDEECQIMPYVGLEHVEKGAGHFSTSFVPNPESVLATKFRFTAKHVLYGKLRPYLNKVVMPNFDGVCTTEILPILPYEDELDRTFLWGYLLTPEFVSWASLIVSGANLPRLSPRDLAKHEILLPPLKEQQRIAGILARADRLRQLRRTALQLSEGYLQSVFLQLFGDPVTNPMGWEVVKLGRTFAENPRIGTAVPAHEGGKQRIVRVGEIGDYRVALEKCATITLKGRDLENFSLRPNDFLLARAIGSEHHLGKASILQKVDFPVVYDSHVMRLRFDSEKANPSFFLHWLKSKGGRARFMKRAGRTAVQFNVNTKQIADIDIPLPPISEQMQFVCIVEQFERLRTQQHEAVRQADHLFATLLHRAFTPSP